VVAVAAAAAVVAVVVVVAVAVVVVVAVAVAVVVAAVVAAALGYPEGSERRHKILLLFRNGDLGNFPPPETGSQPPCHPPIGLIGSYIPEADSLF